MNIIFPTTFHSREPELYVDMYPIIIITTHKNLPIYLQTFTISFRIFPPYPLTFMSRFIKSWIIKSMTACSKKTQVLGPADLCLFVNFNLLMSGGLTVSHIYIGYCAHCRCFRHSLLKCI